MGQRTIGAKNPFPTRKIQYKQLNITCWWIVIQWRLKRMSLMMEKKGKCCWRRVKTEEKVVEVLMTGKIGKCCWWRGSHRSHCGWLIVESLMVKSLRVWDWEKEIRANVVCGVYRVANADVEGWKALYVFFGWNRKIGSKLAISPVFSRFFQFHPILPIFEFLKWFGTLSMYWLVKSYDFTSQLASLTTLFPGVETEFVIIKRLT